MSVPSITPAREHTPATLTPTHYEIHRKDGSVRCWAFFEAGIRRPLYHPELGAHRGFDIGHAGHGTTDLARAILRDVSGADVPLPQARAFAAAFLALSAFEDGRDVTLEEVQHWIAFTLAGGVTEVAS